VPDKGKSKPKRIRKKSEELSQTAAAAEKQKNVTTSSGRKSAAAAEKKSETAAVTAVTNEESLAVKIEQKLPVLVAYFDLYVTLGRVNEAYEDFKCLR
jgi:hypothetical protein